MKKLHLMIIRAFFGPLAVTFLVVVFILVMQFLWKYVDDLMGKGLSMGVVLELLLYAGSSFVPLALPLAILLASLMTMGGLGENSELVPMRSAGLGLGRILMPLIVFTVGLAGASLFFSNNVLPLANLKFHSLLYDMREKKPALSITPGIFYNGIDGFSIRVMDKDVETGRLTDVLIYDHRGTRRGNGTVIRAKQGRMERSADGNFLVLTLEDGHFYDEGGAPPDRRARWPMMRGTFVKDVITMDLSGLGMQRTDEDLYRDHYKMLTMGQLSVGLDSLKHTLSERRTEQASHLRSSLFLLRTVRAPFQIDTAAQPSMRAWLDSLPAQARSETFELAMNMARANAGFADRCSREMEGRTEQLARFSAEWHRKPMLAAACLVFFLIGAPLGGIIRRGGMGLPVVLAILFFLVFHIVSFATEKLVVAGEMEAWLGMWMGLIVLLPIGLFITWKASADSPLLDRDAYHRGWERLRSRLRRSNEDAHPAALQ
ncbi:MAG TPA: LptF/LptG family permease [Flavobacteriales bacterium]|nr:LptF/LptG family permease [Flavobacteriales bacterium]